MFGVQSWPDKIQIIQILKYMIVFYFYFAARCMTLCVNKANLAKYQLQLAGSAFGKGSVEYVRV